jgi:hypothetical protein
MAIYNTNRNRLSTNESQVFSAGKCIWIPRDVWWSDRTKWGTSQCVPTSYKIPGDVTREADAYIRDTTKAAATKVLGNWRNWYLLTESQLWSITRSQTKREYSPTGHVSTYRDNEQQGNYLARTTGGLWCWDDRALFAPANVVLVWNKPGWCISPFHVLSKGAVTFTLGKYIFLRDGVTPNTMSESLLAHEYIHVLQWQGMGWNFATSYASNWTPGLADEASNVWEAPAYLWEMRMHYYRRYGDALPWSIFRPLPQ